MFLLLIWALWAFNCPRVKMVFTTIKKALALTEHLVYLCMLGLGIYFIYQGQVLQKFERMRTSFAVYKECIFELPTIMTYIYPYNDVMELGRDFEIQFATGDTAWALDGINLTLGENKIKDSGLKVNLTKDYFYPNMFRLTPINFPSSM